MLRMDAAVARFWAATKSKDGDPKPLMPWPREEEPEATPEAVLSLLTMSSKKVKK